MPDNTQQRWWSGAVPLAAMAAAAVLFYLPSLIWGLLPGSSYYFNMNWGFAFAEALAWDNPYPRWIPGLWDGAGAGDFYFYAPLPFYAVALAGGLCPGCSEEGAVTLAAIGLRIAAGWGTWGLMRALGLPGGALAAGLFMVLSPYHQLDWFDRQALGELGGAAFLPLFFWGLHEALAGRGWRRLALATALVLFGHLPSMAVAGIAGAVLTLTVWRPAGWRALGRAVGAGVLGFGLAGIYWIPAIGLLDTVTPEILTIFRWQDSFLPVFTGDWTPWHQRLWMPFFALTGLSVAAVVLAGGAIGKAGPRSRAGAAALVLLALVWVLVSPLSWPLWAHTPLQIIQFPWRFLLAADLAFAMALGLAVAGLADAAARRRTGLRVLVMAALAVIALPLATWMRTPVPAVEYPWALEIRVGVLEWLGRDRDRHALAFDRMAEEGPPANLVGDRRVVQVDPAEGAARIEADTPRRIAFAADCPLGCRVVLRRSFWTFWELRDQADGTVIETRMTAGFPLIRADLPAGAGRYEAVLVRPFFERVGWAVSLAALLAMGWAAMRRRSVMGDGAKR